jgi:hypothetical protein
MSLWKSLIDGIKSIGEGMALINLFPSPTEIEIKTDTKKSDADALQSDADALRKDWEAVGNDMWKAIRDESP